MSLASATCRRSLGQSSWDFCTRSHRGAARFAALVNPNDPTAESVIRNVQAGASAIGRHIEVFTASSNRDISTAFASIVQKRIDALVVSPDPLFGSHRVQLAVLAARHAIPGSIPIASMLQPAG